MKTEPVHTIKATDGTHVEISETDEGNIVVMLRWREAGGGGVELTPGEARLLADLLTL